MLDTHNGGNPQFAGHEANALYQVGFDGTIQDQAGFCVIGGSDDDMRSHMEANFRPGLPLGEALRLGRDALQRADNGSPELAPESLEACLLESFLHLVFCYPNLNTFP